MPKRRNLPYDVYTAMSFFADNFADYPPAKRFMEVDDIEKVITGTADKLVNAPVERWNEQTRDRFLASRLASQFLGNRPDTQPASIESQSQWFQPQLLRDQLLHNLDRLDPCDPSSPDTRFRVTESLPKDAIKDGLVLAAAKIKIVECASSKALQPDEIRQPNAVDMIQSALAFARDRSPRFAGFRGFDASQYTDTESFLNIYSDLRQQTLLVDTVTAYRKGRTTKDANAEKVALDKLDTLIKPKSTQGLCIGSSCDITKLGPHQLVSLDDFELSLNEAGSSLRNAKSIAEWKDQVIRLLQQQGHAGSNYRPYVSDPRPRTPIVIPLVVTDDLQSAIESRSAEQIRQIAISLAAVAGKANIGGGLANLDEQLRTTLGRTLDSTFTLARESDNTVRARFGATLQAGAQYSMIPEAHNVTLLVLVPKAYIDSVRRPTIHIEARTDFVDAETGARLTPTSRLDKANYVEEVLQREAVPLIAGTAQDLIGDAANNDMDDFKARLGGDSAPCEKIWTELLEWYSRGADGFVSIPLEKPALPSIVPATQPTTQPTLIAAIDDTKKSITVTVRGTGDLFQQNISAELWTTITPPPTADQTVKLQSDAATFSLSTDKDGNTSISTTQPSSIDISPLGPNGVTVAEKKTGTISVPASQPASIVIPSKDGASVTLNTNHRIEVQSGKPMTATASTGGDSQPTKTVVLWSTATTVGDDKRSITFTFPSLQSLGLASTDKSPDLLMKVHFFRADNDELPSLPADNLVPLQYVAQKPKALAIKLTAQAKVINAKADGTGELLVTVSGFDPSTKPAPAYLTVDGAGLTSANLFARLDSQTGAQLYTPQSILSDQKHAGKVAISSNGVFRLSFEGLNPIANVLVSAEDDSGAKVETGITEIVEQSLHGPSNIVETNVASVKPKVK
jgi:hypothetical protein